MTLTKEEIIEALNERHSPEKQSKGLFHIL